MPVLTRVLVERRKCNVSHICAWASDAWRATGVYNAKSYVPMEAIVVYRCCTAFICGTPIQCFSEDFLEPLKYDVGRATSNPELALRYE